MAVLSIPTEFADILDGDPAICSALHQWTQQLAPILRDNAMPFFPSYTDHSLDHAEQVLATCHALVPKDVLPLLTVNDVCCLVFAVLLHDCGMHLSVACFNELITSEAWKRPICDPDRFGDRPWPDLWRDYLDEVRRFHEAQLKRLLGPSGIGYDPRNLTGKPKNWTESDRLITGEFLRRHHPRLAHEIAMRGFPGVPRAKLPSLVHVLRNSRADLADIAGAVARSHGGALRPCLDDMRSRYPGLIRPHDTAPIYLMALLRIADYLQLTSKRAPPVLLHTKQPQSEASLEAWACHRVVTAVEWNHEDPATIYVSVAPRHSLEIHLQLEHLLLDIQSELDQVSAVLGEAYSGRREKAVNSLHLSRTRVRSNLNDPPLLKTLPYVPRRIGFTARGPELMQLLIAPLYGNSPGIGIRELMQNAVDAVRELKEVEGNGTGISEHGRADVLVRIFADEEGAATLEIRDRGLGMTLDTVERFFLCAGASFRGSPQWRQLFEREGQHRPLRSGRFGIGLFAAFLVGDEMEVETRYCSEPRGLRFRATIQSDPIEVLKEQQVDRGTTIRIRLSPAILERLVTHTQSWDWFVLDDVVVERQVFGEELEQSVVLPAEGSRLPPDWNRLGSSLFTDVQWAYSDSASLARQVPKLTCNGIVIEQEPYLAWHHLPDLTMEVPCISVFDPNGNLPLTLARDHLLSGSTEPFPGLEEEVIEDLLAFCYVNGPSRREAPRWCQELQYPGLLDPSGVERDEFGWEEYLVRNRVLPNPWAYSHSGFVLADSGLVSRLAPDTAISLLGKSRGAAPKGALCFGIEVERDSDKRWEYPDEFLDAVLQGSDLNIGVIGWICDVPSRMLVRRRSELDAELRRRSEHGARTECTRAEIGECCVYSWCGAPRASGLKRLFQEHCLQGGRYGERIEAAVIEWRRPEWEWITDLSPLASAWIELFGTNELPFDRKRRRELVVGAGRSFRNKVRKWVKRSS